MSPMARKADGSGFCHWAISGPPKAELPMALFEPKHAFKTSPMNARKGREGGP
jgi:hypothetical protein